MIEAYARRWGKWHSQYPPEPYDSMRQRDLNFERLVYNARRRHIARVLWEALRYRLWGRWDDVLFYLDEEPENFYARFGVERPRAYAAVYEVLDIVTEIEHGRS